MPTTKKELPAYTEKLYDLCDVFDRVADSQGDRAAEASVDRLLGQTIKSYPRAAEVALGKTLVTRYKQAPDPVQQAGERFIAALRAKMPDEQALAYFDQMARVLGAQSDVTPGGVLDSDEKPMSAGATKASMAKLYDEAIKGYRR